MSFPWTNADPAPFVFALSTSHVIASSVLLHWRFALRTIFRIGVFPMRRLGIVFAFLGPELYLIASGRSVSLSMA